MLNWIDIEVRKEQNKDLLRETEYRHLEKIVRAARSSSNHLPNPAPVSPWLRSLPRALWTYWLKLNTMLLQAKPRPSDS